MNLDVLGFRPFWITRFNTVLNFCDYYMGDLEWLLSCPLSY